MFKSVSGPISILAAATFATVPVPSVSQSQPIATSIYGVQIQTVDNNEYKISFLVDANGGEGYAPEGSSFVIDVYNEGFELFAECSAGLGVGGEGSCNFASLPLGGWLDIDYEGAPGYTPPYASSSLSDYSFAQ